MVRATAATPSALTLTQNAAQTHADPAVNIREYVPVTMLKVPEPSLERLAQGGRNAVQAAAVGAFRLGTHGILQLVHAFLPRQAKPATKGIAEKVKAVRLRIHHLRFGGMK